MFTGTYTAIVTPFDRDGNLAEDTFCKLIARQAEAGVNGIAAAGTTGESPTLTIDEHKRVIDLAVETCRGSMQVIAGTGANATAEALALTEHARQAGADGTLQVTPYYNKPSQEGLYRHFSAVADLGLPVMLYNVPGRTSREIDVDTIARLAQHPNIVAVKEAGGSVERVSRILDVCDITVLSGDDSLALPMMSAGAGGLVSVAANVAPEPVARMIRLAQEEHWTQAAALHREYFPLFRDLFIDTNPIPVKAALGMLGLAEEVYRLPLCAMEPELKNRLRETLDRLGLTTKET